MGPSKVFTVRLPEEQIGQLEKLAAFDNVRIAHEIREAVNLLIEERKRDPEFRARVLAAYHDAHNLLEELREGDPEESKVLEEALRPDKVIHELTAQPIEARAIGAAAGGRS